jgi:hypothetical protein
VNDNLFAVCPKQQQPRLKHPRRSSGIATIRLLIAHYSDHSERVSSRLRLGHDASFLLLLHTKLIREQVPVTVSKALCYLVLVDKLSIHRG